MELSYCSRATTMAAVKGGEFVRELGERRGPNWQPYVTSPDRSRSYGDTGAGKEFLGEFANS